jgi:hypothetical protein
VPLQRITRKISLALPVLGVTVTPSSTQSSENDGSQMLAGRAAISEP